MTVHSIDLRRRDEPEVTRYSWDQYQNDLWVAFNGQRYLLSGGTGGWTKTEDLEHSFTSYVSNLYKSNGVVFAITLARLLLFAEARFCWFEIQENGEDGRPKGRQGLEVLERPWPNCGTGELLARMEQDVTLGGNFFAVREGDRLRRLRPDWVTIILTAPPAESTYSDVRGYWYHPGRSHTNAGEPGPGDDVYLPDEICHWSPLPDPEAQYRGMSWLTPVVREVMADKAARDHKLAFFENGAQFGAIISAKESLTNQQYKEWKANFEGIHTGTGNAYKTLFLASPVDTSVTTANMQQLDFKVVQGAGETRLCAAGGVPPIIVGLSEGLASATYSNYGMARRKFGDHWAHPQWKSASQALSSLVDPPGEDLRLGVNTKGIAFLREDAKDLAEIQQIKASTLSTLIMGGFTPDSSVAAVEAEDLSLLEHTGLTSVQLVPPGTDPLAEEEFVEDEFADEEDLAFDEEFDEELGRARYDVRNPKGAVGGGRFRKLSDAIVALLKDDADLDDFTQPQLRKAADQLGLVTPRARYSRPHLERLLREHAGGKRPEPDADAPAPRKRTPAKKAPAKKAAPRKATTKTAPDSGRASEGADALAAAPGSLVTGAGLTTSQKSALRHYQQQGTHDRINSALREGRDVSKLAQVDRIDEALDASRLTEDVVVYRGVPGRLTFGDRFDDDLVGFEWVAPEFLSTSAQPSEAEGFGYSDDARANDEGATVLRLRVPRGTPAVQMSRYETPGGLPDEAELLLARGLRLRVVGDRMEERGTNMIGIPLPPRRVLDVEVILDEPDAPEPDSVEKARTPGSVRVSDLRPGDMVPSLDPADDEPREVTHVSTVAGGDRVVHYRDPRVKMGGTGAIRLEGDMEVDVTFRGDEPDSVQQARTRQADIDDARRYADVAAELDELIANEASDETLLARLDARIKREGLGDELAEVREALARPRDVEIENKIRAAYRAVLADRPRRRRGDSRLLPWVSMADLRDRLGEDLPRAEVDRVLDRMIEQPDVRLQQELNQRALTDRDRAASVVIGNQERDIIQIEDPSDRPSPRDRAKSLLAAMTERHGITQDSSAGASARFDPKVHQSIDGSIRQGQAVEVVRPGFTLDRDGEKIQIRRPVVEAVDEPAPQLSDAEVENRIRAAYRDLRRPGLGYVSIADLRERLGDLPRSQQDAALKRMIRQPGVSLIPEADQSALRQRDRDAAPTIGGEEKHLLYIEDPVKQSSPAPDLASLDTEDRLPQEIVQDFNAQHRAEVQAITARLQSGEIDAAEAARLIGEAGRRRQEAENKAARRDLPSQVFNPTAHGAAPVDAAGDTATEALRDELDLKKLPELKELAKSRGLKVSGRKRELVDRLVDSIKRTEVSGVALSDGELRELRAATVGVVKRSPQIGRRPTPRNLLLQSLAERGLLAPVPGGYALTDAGRRAIDGGVPSDSPGEPQVADRIRGAYDELARRPAQPVLLSDIRDRLPDVDRETLDRVLVEMYADGRVNLIPRSDRGNLTARDRVAAIRTGGEDRHQLMFEDGTRPAKVKDSVPRTGDAALRRVPEGSVAGDRAQAPVRTEPRKRSLDEAWDAAGLDAEGSPGRSMKEIREDISSGKITPEEGIRRMEDEIAFNKEDLAEVDANLRQPDLTDEERAKLQTNAAVLTNGIEAQEKASKFLRMYFRDEKPTVEEVKLEVTPEQFEVLERATPESLREAAKEMGLRPPKGESKNEIMQDMVIQVAEQVARDQGIIPKKAPAKKAAKAAKKAAPAVPVEREKIDARLIGTGLDFDENDKWTKDVLSEVQTRLDEGQSPASVGRELDERVRSRRTINVYENGSWHAESSVLTPEERAQRKAENQANYDRIQADTDRMEELATRLKATRRKPVKKASPEVQAAEKLADSAEARLINDRLVQMGKARNREQADQALDGLTMQELRRIAESLGEKGRSKRELRDKILDRLKKFDPEPPPPAAAPTPEAPEAPTPRALARGERIGARAKAAGIEPPALPFSGLNDAEGEANRMLQRGESPTAIARMLRERAAIVAKADLNEEGRRFRVEHDKDTLRAARKANAEYLRRLGTMLQQDEKKKRVSTEDRVAARLLERMNPEVRDQILADMPEGDRKAVDEAVERVRERREVEVENRIRAAYRDAATRPGAFVSLGDIRARLGGDLDREEVDRLLLRMGRDPGTMLVPENIQKSLTDADREGGITLFGRTLHHIRIDDPSDRPLPDRDEAKGLQVIQGEGRGKGPSKATRPTLEVVGPGRKMSTKTPLPNTWGGNVSEVHFHEDGAIGMALDRMGENRLLDVDGEPLQDVLGKLATRAVRGQISQQQLIQEIRQLAGRFPQGSAVGRQLDRLADQLDKPPAPSVDLPDDTPGPLVRLMERLRQVPLASKKRDNFTEIDELLDLIRNGDWRLRDNPRRRAMILATELRRRLLNRRHESEEGKFEIDRAIREAMRELEEQMKGATT